MIGPAPWALATVWAKGKENRNQDAHRAPAGAEGEGHARRQEERDHGHEAGGI